MWEDSLGRQQGLPKTAFLFLIFRQDEGSAPTQSKLFLYIRTVERQKMSQFKAKTQTKGPRPDIRLSGRRLLNTIPVISHITQVEIPFLTHPIIFVVYPPLPSRGLQELARLRRSVAAMLPCSDTRRTPEGHSCSNTDGSAVVYIPPFTRGQYLNMSSACTLRPVLSSDHCLVCLGSNTQTSQSKPQCFNHNLRFLMTSQATCISPKHLTAAVYIFILWLFMFHTVWAAL